VREGLARLAATETEARQRLQQARWQPHYRPLTPA
jgi:hypothetical protein